MQNNRKNVDDCCRRDIDAQDPTEKSKSDTLALPLGDPPQNFSDTQALPVRMRIFLRKRRFVPLLYPSVFVPLLYHK